MSNSDIRTDIFTTIVALFITFPFMLVIFTINLAVWIGFPIVLMWNIYEKFGSLVTIGIVWVAFGALYVIFDP